LRVDPLRGARVGDLLYAHGDLHRLDNNHPTRSPISARSCPEARRNLC
jgi:hypothetical protein